MRLAHVIGSTFFWFIAIKIASANACGFLGGTTQPVSPTMNAASPTSVVTQGVEQAIASAKTLGKASPNDEVNNEPEALAMLTEDGDAEGLSS